MPEVWYLALYAVPAAILGVRGCLLIHRFVRAHSIVTEAGMYALRERRQHVTQEDFELAVSKVGSQPVCQNPHLVTWLIFIPIARRS